MNYIKNTFNCLENDIYSINNFIETKLNNTSLMETKIYIFIRINMYWSVFEQSTNQ